MNNQMSDKDYFDYKALSKSQINVFIGDNPKRRNYNEFWKKCVFNPSKEAWQETDATVFGNLCHCLLLEPQNFDLNFCQFEFGKSRINKTYLKERDKWPNYKLVTDEEIDRAQSMIIALQKRSYFMKMIDGSQKERPFFWTHNETQLPLKGKIDAIKRTKNGIIILDYKTTNSIKDFHSHSYQKGNQIQFAMYENMVNSIFKEDLFKFIFIVQNSTSGKEDEIAFFEYDNEAKEFARWQLQKALDEINDCLTRWKTGDESIWQQWPDEVLDMQIPAWYQQQF